VCGSERVRLVLIGADRIPCERGESLCCAVFFFSRAAGDGRAVGWARRALFAITMYFGCRWRKMPHTSTVVELSNDRLERLQ